MRECVPASVQSPRAGRTGRAANAAAHAQPSFSTPPGPLGEGGPSVGGKGDFSFRVAFGVPVCSPKKGLVGESGGGKECVTRALISAESGCYSSRSSSKKFSLCQLAIS